ncbi:MAG: hypothetical protein LUD02_09410 [Tannerellaceae bacterium]|nr:hypothetical protein [Tannerellaceae bacterium]MCD8264332.1 hypothetical protein [Tannerellaceae bacterium]
MKKSMLAVVILLSTIGMANAQTNVNFGVSLEGNLTNVKLTKFEGAKTSLTREPE